MTLLALLSCLSRIALPTIHTTWLYAIHPSKQPFLALQLTAVCLGITISTISVVMFFTGIPKHIKSKSQMKEYRKWLGNNLSEKAVSVTWHIQYLQLSQAHGLSSVVLTRWVTDIHRPSAVQASGAVCSRGACPRHRVVLHASTGTDQMRWL
jgi:hypothetical protein